MAIRWRRLVAVCLLVSSVSMLSLVLGLLVGGWRPQPAFASSPPDILAGGPDLTVQSVQLTPPAPDPGQDVSIEIRVANIGAANASGFRVYLYVDPPGPPTPTTPDTSVFFIFGLGAGQSFTWTPRGAYFTTPGCNHSVYVWVDRDNQVSEDNENNNIASTTVCVGNASTPTPTPTQSLTPTPTPTTTPPPGCQPDAYEPDESCTAARVITTDGVHQMHNLCPLGDQDWVKFTATVGITYTLTAGNVGPDGDIVMALYDHCNQPPLSTSDPSFGNGAQVAFQPPATGDYFLQVRHHSPTYGPDTAYELFVTAATDCSGDAYEDDNSCSAARDITIGGPPQMHLFCRPGDEDWVKFAATSGAHYLISAHGVGPDADPVLAIYDECAFGAPLTQGQSIEWTAPADAVYYIAVQNHVASVSGPTTQYTLAVLQSLCTADGFEVDNAPAQARPLAPGAEQTHDSCPTGDGDWTRFQANQGQLYVAETFALGRDSDTVLCLFAPDGTTQIACDDNGGGGLASRLRWTAPTADAYYLHVQQYDSGVSGPTTSYHLAISAGEPLDDFEPDNSAEQAKSVATDGTGQHHNFTPAGDQDWVKFDAVAGDPYVIRTYDLMGDTDTILTLFGSDGSTELTANDDYGTGAGSRITYIFPTAGTYYVRARHYRTNRSGRGTAYTLSVTHGALPPTATPTATPPPTPGPTETPPPSGIRTLIVTNRERLEALYGASRATNVMNSLAQLAGDPRVRGMVVQVEDDAASLVAFTQWNASPLNTTLANNTASAVRNRILSALNVNPSVEYIVIVGNDRVIPFRRTRDRTKSGEDYYQAFVSSNTTIWASARDNMTLTDDYYVSLSPKIVKGQEVYVPDLAVGRLPEGPEEMVAFINNFLAGDHITMRNVLVTGYDFVVDTGQTISTTVASKLAPGGHVDSSLVGVSWAATTFRQRQLDTTPRFDVQFINGHASQHLQGAPSGGGVADADVVNFGSSDLRRSLIATLGCHSGLNEVADLPAGLDLAQAFFKRGANYIANTGYGWGSPDGLGWSERLLDYYSREMTHGASVPIGKGILAAKRRYFSETAEFDEYDEKVMQESTLYGLPQYVLSSGGTLDNENPFPSVQFQQSLALPSGPVRLGNVNITLPGSTAAFDSHQTTDGTFFGINQSTLVVAGEPMQPKFYANVTSASAGRVHGTVLRSGAYSDTSGPPNHWGQFDPLVARPINEYSASRAEPPLARTGWLPPQVAAIQNVTAPGGSDTLITPLGQYNTQTGQERLFSGLNLDLLYSTSPDWTPPVITYVGEHLDSAQHAADVKVEASDLSGILSGVVTYTNGNGQWQSVNLAYDSSRSKWIASIPARATTLYYVQVVDQAGNVRVANNNGHYYAVPSATYQLFLPHILRSRQ